jgi:hypothetical protein
MGPARGRSSCTWRPRRLARRTATTVLRSRRHTEMKRSCKGPPRTPGSNCRFLPSRGRAPCAFERPNDLPPLRPQDPGSVDFPKSLLPQPARTTSVSPLRSLRGGGHARTPARRKLRCTASSVDSSSSSGGNLCATPCTPGATRKCPRSRGARSGHRFGKLHVRDAPAMLKSSPRRAISLGFNLSPGVQILDALASCGSHPPARWRAESIGPGAALRDGSLGGARRGPAAHGSTAEAAAQTRTEAWTSIHSLFVIVGGCRGLRRLAAMCHDHGTSDSGWCETSGHWL